MHVDSNRATGTEGLGQKDRENNRGRGTVTEAQESRNRDMQTDRKTGSGTEEQRQEHREHCKNIWVTLTIFWLSQLHACLFCV